jgi:ParB family transcriptional regulator, chromosome partitioning protein
MRSIGKKSIDRRPIGKVRNFATRTSARSRKATDKAVGLVQAWQRLEVRPYDLADALVTLRDAEGLSQQELANKIGKSPGEISKILSLLELDPAVQKTARQDTTGRIGRRHLYAVRGLPAAKQRDLIRQVQQGKMTADGLEQLAALDEDRRTSGRSRTLAKRFKTSQATITIVFRKEDVTRRDILDAIREVRTRLAPASAAS